MSQGSGVQVPPGVFADVAQSVERRTFNPVVAGSSPAIGNKKGEMNLSYVMGFIWCLGIFLILTL